LQRSLPDAPKEEDLRPLRVLIDEIDRAVIKLLNRRAEYANDIGNIKKRLGLPVYVPSREKEVIRNVIEANEGPLESDAVRRLFERIIDETRALERRKYQDDSNV